VHVRTAAVVGLISLSFAPAALADTAAPGTLTVDGQGSVKVTPDVASLSLTVTRVAPTAPPALSSANRSADAIVRAVRGLGVPAAGIQTESVNTSCGRVRVGPKGHKHLVRRCTARESLSITSAAAIAGRVIDAATHAGATTIDGPDFSFSNPSAGQIAAQKAAIADARSQANAAAAQLGYTVTGVQSISINPQSGVIAAPAPSSSGSAGSSTPTTVHPGTEEVDATVAIVFTIAPVTPPQ
jgi:uncharacterized protein YggE